MKPSSGAINIEASARKVDVDNRISLRNYYRIANNLIKQANIYRRERNTIDLYVMLLRFSSLITETIPRHRDYNFSLHSERKLFKEILLNALNELETLKPVVQSQLVALNGRSRKQLNNWEHHQQNGFSSNSLEWPPVNNLTLKDEESRQAIGITRKSVYTFSTVQENKLSTKAKEEQFRKLSLSLPLPKPETLSRHSILGPNGLHGQWQPPIANNVIQYPRTLDLTPIEIPSLLPQTRDVAFSKDNGAPEHEETKSIVDEVLSLHEGNLQAHQYSGPMIDLENTKSLPEVDIIKELCPPPVLAEVHDVAVSGHGCNVISTQTLSLQDELLQSKEPVQVHISPTLMDNFMRVAKSNTTRNLETCGVLAGSLENRKFYVTALIIPKQESTSDSCQTTNEEEIFDYQEKNSLFPLGWIHTHPTQSCFMSSIDVHTHYAYQVMLPEAIAIVMAPRDGSRKHGIFRLTTPGGMSVIRNCDQRGFHPHKPPPDGGDVYEHCSDVHMNPGVKLDIVDLR